MRRVPMMELVLAAAFAINAVGPAAASAKRPKDVLVLLQRTPGTLKFAEYMFPDWHFTLVGSHETMSCELPLPIDDAQEEWRVKTNEEATDIVQGGENELLWCTPSAGSHVEEVGGAPVDPKLDILDLSADGKASLVGLAIVVFVNGRECKYTADTLKGTNSVSGPLNINLSGKLTSVNCHERGVEKKYTLSTTSFTAGDDEDEPVEGAVFLLS